MQIQNPVEYLRCSVLLFLQKVPSYMLDTILSLSLEMYIILWWIVVDVCIYVRNGLCFWGYINCSVSFWENRLLAKFRLEALHEITVLEIFGKIFLWIFSEVFSIVFLENNCEQLLLVYSYLEKIYLFKVDNRNIEKGLKYVQS